MNRRRFLLSASLVCFLVSGIGGSTLAAPQVITYTYDALGRLTEASYDDAVAVVYEYDLSGNVVHMGAETPADAPGGAGGTEIPSILTLGPSTPNPSMGRSQFRYGLPHSSRVSLAIFDAAGRRVRAMVNGKQAAGYHSAIWDGRNDRGERASSGIYFIRLHANGEMKIQPAVLLR